MSDWNKRIRLLAPRDRARYEELAENFEAAWAGPTEPAIEAYLEASNLRLLLLVHFVKCDFEFRHGLGQNRCVEDYLKRFPELAGESDALLELVLCEYALDRPNRPTADELIARFPRLALQLRPELAALTPRGEWSPPSEYHDLQVIGSGNWGVVYKAMNRQMERVEAIKVVLPIKASESRINRLRQEIPIAARLNHPNIVRAYHGGDSNGVPYFSMEFCPNGSLAERLKNQGPFAPAAAAELVKTLAAAVHQMHVFHVHRDLKPSNILFGDRDVPKIADFGLAINLNEVVRDEIAGTPLYMAPEQVDPSRDPIGPQTDVWALGVILWELVSGTTPFKGKSAAELYVKILERPPDPFPNMPADLAAICEKCLQKRRSQRYQTAQALADDLQTFLAGGLVQARTHSSYRRTTHWLRRNPIKTLAATAVVAFAIGYAFLQRHLSEQKVAQANERREQAEKLVESERLREHDAVVAAARQAVRRGAWGPALERYESAIEHRRPDQLRLRIERLNCYFATNKTKELEAELTDLEKTPLGEFEAQVKLMRGAWILCDLSQQQQAKGRQFIAEALRNRDRLFSEADKHLADGLAATRFKAAFNSFEKAAKSDPFHHLAAVCHAVTLAAVGEPELAAARARMMREITPEDATPELVDALIAFSSGDRKGLNASIDSYRAKIPASQSRVERFRSFLFNLVDLMEVLARIEARQSQPNDFNQLGSGLAKLRLSNDPLVLPVPAIGICVQRWSELANCYGEWAFAHLQGQIVQDSLTRIEAANNEYPDAGLFLLLGVGEYSKAIAPTFRGDIPETIKKLSAASEMGEHSVKAPSIVRSSSTRFFGRALAFLSDISVLRLDQAPNGDRIERMRNHVHPLVTEGRSWKNLRAEFMELAVFTAVARISDREATAWEPHTDVGKRRISVRNQQIAAILELLLDDFAVDDPANPRVPALRKTLADFKESQSGR